jgi:surfeit locus 1 family protein
MRRWFTPRWLVTTLLVVAAVGGMARLGIWQLERLAERRAFNARVQAQVSAPPLDLNGPIETGALYDMEYRQVIVRGVYAQEQEILMRNQVYQSRPGYHLLTPLRLENSAYVVLVDRGFIDFDQGRPESDAVSAADAANAAYAVPGPVEVRGILRRPHVPRLFGVPDPTLSPGQTRLEAWNAVNLERLQAQIDGPLLPVYVLAAPDPAYPGPPYAQVEQPDLSEGPHLGYALQWFAFAAILGLGYPFFVRKQLASGVGEEKKHAQVLVR